MDILRDKTLVMLIGPTAIGKSTLMNAVEQTDTDFKRVGGFTTRDPRSNDEPGQYRYYSKEEVANKNSRGEILQYAEYPTTGHIYRTELADYHAKYNLKDVLVNAVDEFRDLPFKRSIAISLTTDPVIWENWFMSRYGSITEEAVKRLKEAQLSIEWSLNQDHEHMWLINASGKLDLSARTIVNMVRNDSYMPNAPKQARQMLQTVERLLSYE